MKKLIMLALLFISLQAHEFKDNQWYSCIAPDGESELYLKVVNSNMVITDDIKLHKVATGQYVAKNKFGEVIQIRLSYDKTIIFMNSYTQEEKWTCSQNDEPPIFTINKKHN